MRKVLILVLFLSLAFLPAVAQFTTVTGTVTDPNGLPYAFGTIAPVLVFSGGTPTLPSGGPYFPPSQASGLAMDGSFTVTLANNTLLTPAGSKWNFVVCSGVGTVQPAFGKGPICFSLAAPITISGASQSISAQLSAAAPALTFAFGGGGGGGVAPIVLTSAQAGATSDVRVSQAIASLTGGNGIVWANDSTAQSWAACPTFGAGTVHLVLFPVTYSIAVNCTIPANVTLEFMRGAILNPANATTTTILGVVIASRQQIFSNALAGQGTISFTNSTKTVILYPQWFGAKVDGATDDLPAMQAVADVAGAATASTPGASTIDLGCGVYRLVGTWTIASSNGQHHVNVVGVNPLCTTINSTVGVFPATAIYLSKEKFVSLSGFLLHSATLHQGVGITLGGLTGSGTQTNGSTLDNITIDSFDTGMLSTDSVLLSTSSEMIFNQMVLQNNNTGFVNSSQNGLNYVFNMLQTTNNTLGINMASPGLTVNGGASSSNGTDFQFLSGVAPGNTLIDFRSETAVTQCINMPGQTGVILIRYTCQGMSTPTAHTAITQASGTLSIINSYIGGQILETAGGNLTIENSTIIDPNNTWSLTSQPSGMAPGFRISAGGSSGCATPLQDCGHFDVRNTMIIDASNITVLRVPSLSGWYTQGTAGQQVAIATNIGQGAALTVSGNAISPTAYVHHVGAGLIKNINLPTNATFPNMGIVNWEMPCIQLIADAAYTTDTTGNVAVALTAVTNQVITWCYDPGTTKWYPSGGAGAFTTLTSTTDLSTTNCGASGTAANPSVVACGSARAGAVACDVASSAGTCVVNTSAVTANSEIFIEEVTTENARLGVTCNTSPSVLPAIPVAAKSAGVSFTINMPTIAANPACFVYHVVN